MGFACSRILMPNIALKHEAEMGNYERVKSLIAAGADVNSADKYGNTPLIKATKRYCSNIRAISSILLNLSCRYIK